MPAPKNPATKAKRKSKTKAASEGIAPTVMVSEEPKGAGRPTGYRPEYAEQARKLAIMGLSDEALASFFDVDLGVLAKWARDFPEFLIAISPDEREIKAYQAGKAERSARKQSYRKAARLASPSKRLENSIRARLYAALKGKSDGALFRRLGYSPDELVRHIQIQFREGMAWGNYGKWHVDHKKPVAKFDLHDPAQFAECWALENLQPLWAQENTKKGASYVSP